ncbi:citrate lyase acyl carrier protein [Denitrovibrio acetiphilus DSM 12809]|uniref:Citrate lyase acyl carrier protein n=1 Tax=Denitrovibrio acetiphilus (strain DSM 12809 / NBRC 114555 / N2460) TaxID=522772 RepID=D4H8L0_DENA2|nr:citrate lyase acyl carrier protein [Denitrovibrio acetiphilus]ADD68359.1 citrate lyase acyl carrier protein [Denitrovibrio acetiphilus DSM 12809]
MKIMKKAQAGTMQSSDLMVFVEPAEELLIDIESTVAKQFEHLIRAKAQDTLKGLDVENGHIRINDRGALDYAIEARLKTAVQRSAGVAK